MKLALTEIIVDPTISIRRRIDDGVVAEYAEILDRLPPVVVYDTAEGHLLADGFHRVTAAVRRKLSHLTVDLHRGNREAAIEYAAIANLQHGLRLEPDEKRTAILRVHELHSDWNAERLAKTMGLPVAAVEITVVAAKVKASVPESVHLPETHAFLLGRAPAQERAALAKAATKEKWTRDELLTAIQNIKDPTLPQDRKDAILRGDAVPIADKEGEPAVLLDTIGRKLAEAKERDLKIPMWEALERLARLRKVDPPTLAIQLKVKELEHLRRELPDDIAWLQNLLKAAGEAMSRPKVVKIR